MRAVAVEFSQTELAELSAQIQQLTQQLLSFEAELEASGAPNERLEQHLSVLNERIFALRQHWRSMLELSSPKPVS